MPTDVVNSVKVLFFGICTHIKPESLPEETVDWSHRVVLVNASDRKQNDRIAPKLKEAGVDAHVARLQIKTADLIGEPPATPFFPITFNDGVSVEWKLDGVVLTFNDAIATVANPALQQCVPKLSTYCHPLPSAGPAMYAQDAARTACYFDFPSSVIENWGLNGGAAMSLIKVSMPNTPTLVVRTFGGEMIAFALRPEAEITVSNIPEDKETDADQDFLLHYLTVVSEEHPFPGQATFPDAAMPCTQILNTYNPPRNLGDLTTPGCSNSNYP